MVRGKLVVSVLTSVRFVYLRRSTFFPKVDDSLKRATVAYTSLCLLAKVHYSHNNIISSKAVENHNKQQPTVAPLCLLFVACGRKFPPLSFKYSFINNAVETAIKKWLSLRPLSPCKFEVYLFLIYKSSIFRE